MTSSGHSCSEKYRDCFHPSGSSEHIDIPKVKKDLLGLIIGRVKEHFKTRGILCHWCKKIKGESDCCNSSPCRALEHGFANLNFCYNLGTCNSFICLDYWLEKINKRIDYICASVKKTKKSGGRGGKRERKDLAKAKAAPM